jgi:hypothetical protein
MRLSSAGVPHDTERAAACAIMETEDRSCAALLLLTYVLR